MGHTRRQAGRQHPYGEGDDPAVGDAAHQAVGPARLAHDRVQDLDEDPLGIAPRRQGAQDGLEALEAYQRGLGHHPAYRFRPGED